MHVFYAPDIAPQKGYYVFSSEESRHSCKVLRLGTGDQVTLVNGRGQQFTAEISEADPRKVKVNILEIVEAPRPRDYFLHLAIAPTKRMERFEWFVEKATEVGVDRITPIITQNSERRVLNVARLQKKMIAALKQSLNLFLPELHAAEEFSTFIQQHSADQKGIAYCGAGDKATLQDLLVPGGQYLILIGPEGDFSEGEIERAETQGYQLLTLGESRLRTETAGLAVCFEANWINR